MSYSSDEVKRTLIKAVSQKREGESKKSDITKLTTIAVNIPVVLIPPFSR